MLADLGPQLEVGNMFSVAGKNVLVTGGARGIGLMIAAGFAMNGARVAISSRDVEANEAAVVKLAEIGVGIGKDAFCVPADLSDKGEVERVAAEVGEKFGGKIHCLVRPATCP